MQFKKILISLVALLLLCSCVSSGSKKSHVDPRTETLNQVANGSAEKINLELGVGYLKRGKVGDVDVALSKFKKAVLINPKYALAHSMLANVYDQKGLFVSAEKHYKLSIKHNNGSPDIINNYANFLCQRGSYNLAIEKYLQVVKNPQYKTPASAYENAGVCAIKAKDLLQAEGFFRKVLNINNKQANSLYNLMLIYLDKNNHMKARAFLQRLEQVVRPTPEMLVSGYKIEKALNNQYLANKYLTTLKSEYPEFKFKSLKNIK
ncbi:MAG: type IV pilus biogenesis/stability protein PilW [Alcanivoracaceae bacterium]|nr:type IV pilus biogenesis/stability protein PilW [Alcanivoracaceae bacterium]